MKSLKDAMFCDDCQIDVDAREVVCGGNEIKLVGECVDCEARIVDTYEFAGRETDKPIADVEGEDEC